MPLTFHTKKLCSRLYSIEISFLFTKTTTSIFKPFFGGLDVTYAFLPWLIGNPVVDFLLVIIERFLLTLTVETYVIRGNLSKSTFFWGGGSLWAPILGGRGRRPPTYVGIRNAMWLLFYVVSKYQQYTISFRHKARLWQKDRTTTLKLDRAIKMEHRPLLPPLSANFFTGRLEHAAIELQAKFGCSDTS